MIPFTVAKKAGGDRFHYLTVLMFDSTFCRFLCKQDKRLVWLTAQELTEQTEFAYFVEKNEKKNN